MIVKPLAIPLLQSILVNKREFIIVREILLIFVAQQAFNSPAIECEQRGHIATIKLQEGLVKELLIWLQFDEVNDVTLGFGYKETVQNHKIS